MVGAIIYLLSTLNLWLTSPDLLYVEAIVRKENLLKQRNGGGTVGPGTLGQGAWERLPTS